MAQLTEFPKLFGARRKLALPPLQPRSFHALDGTALQLFHCPGHGPAVVLAPGTAMTSLSFCLDSVRTNLAEFLHAAGFDLWLFDWRSSPLLPGHAIPYSLDDVAQYDWPAAVDVIRASRGGGTVSVLAHCLSAPALFLSLLRGHLSRDHLDAVVASQVALHLTLPTIGKLKSLSHVDAVLPQTELIHLRPQDVSLHVADTAISALALLLPPSCGEGFCQRQRATFGNLVRHSQLDPETHALLGDLIPEVCAGFLQDVADKTRQESILTDDDYRHMARLALPITLLSGEHNETLIPEATMRSHALLSQTLGHDLFCRHVLAGYGHLDCLIGKDADRDVFPLIAASLGKDVRAKRVNRTTE